MTTAIVKGDKLPREITKMETGEAVREHLIAKGFDGQIYMATRAHKQVGTACGMVYRVKKTGEYVFAC